eukprot:scaffold90294_cov18-Prasinocladus_malaysianus.AAC.3
MGRECTAGRPVESYMLPRRRPSVASSVCSSDCARLSITHYAQIWETIARMPHPIIMHARPTESAIRGRLTLLPGV